MYLPLREDEDYYYFYLYGPYELRLGKEYELEEGPDVVIQINPNSDDGTVQFLDFNIELTDEDDEFEVSKYTLSNGKKGDMEHPVSDDFTYLGGEESTIRTIISRAEKIVRTFCPGHKISNWEYEMYDDEQGSAVKFEYDGHNFLVVGFGNELYDVYRDGQYWNRIEAKSDFEAKDMTIMEYEVNG